MILVGEVPFILTPPILRAVQAASASEPLTSVRAPANAGGRCVFFFSCSCMSVNTSGNVILALFVLTEVCAAFVKHIV